MKFKTKSVEMCSLKLLGCIGLLAMVATSCYRSPTDSVTNNDLDVVITNYNSNLSYGQQFTTYTITDSFFVASNVESVDKDIVNDIEFRREVKKVIRNSMDAYGYTEMTNDTVPPDLVFNVTILYVNVKGISYTPVVWSGPSFGGYWGYGYGYGWGGGWNYYWNYIPTYYSFDVGSLVVDMLDFKNRDTIPEGDSSYISVENIWNAGVTGQIRNGTLGSQERLNAAIQQGFDQSSYLKK